jgi:3-phenylpropionate/trans-cinnamate dioxygenase ferredoxin reductase subunit
VPYFFSDQYDVGMEYSGLHQPGGYDDVVYRGDVASREFCVFWLSAGAVIAGMNVNIWDVHSDIRQLIKSRAHVDPKRLADPGTPLADTAKG